MKRLLSLLLLFWLSSSRVHAQADPTSRSWNQPVEPYRIAGNLYYVGASDITSFLIATPAGLILIDGDEITMGGTKLIAHLTPGHTPGCTTWTMKVTEGGKSYDVVFVCSTSLLPGLKLIDNQKYPKAAEDFEKTFQALKSLPCDIFLAPHASFYHGLDKAERLRKGETQNPFIDPDGYKAYLERGEKAFRDRLAAEKSSAKVESPKH